MSALEFYYQKILANAPSSDHPELGEAELLYKQLMEIFRKSYASTEADEDLVSIRAVLSGDGLKNNTTQGRAAGKGIKVDLPESAAVIIDDVAFGKMKMYPFSGKYTVGGAVKYIEFEFAGHVKAFLDEILPLQPSATIVSGYRSRAAQIAAAISGSPGNPDHSNHRKGLAIDVNIAGMGGNYQKSLRWLLSYSEKYGLYNKISWDPVHLSYNGY